MQDAIIKGNGNSRYLKSVASFLTLYPTYEDFAQALIAGTLPIDLNGINAAGWTQQGTALNKGSLLSDATESAIWGAAGNRTVDAALAALVTSVGERAKIATGSYVGTGTYGADNPCSLTFDFVPRAVLLFTMGTTTTQTSYSAWHPPFAIITSGRGVSTLSNDGSAGVQIYFHLNVTLGKTTTWYNTSRVEYQMNESGWLYQYIAFS